MLNVSVYVQFSEEWKNRMDIDSTLQNEVSVIWNLITTHIKKVKINWYYYG